MATKFYKFSGTLKWTQNLTDPDDYNGIEYYKCNLMLDEESQARFAESGIRTKAQTDKEGDTFNVFKRPPKKKIKDEVVEFGPPEVVDSEGRQIAAMIANGSKAEIEVVVYDTMAGKGHRLNKVVVTDLIEYEPQEKMEAEEAAAFE